MNSNPVRPSESSNNGAGTHLSIPVRTVRSEDFFISERQVRGRPANPRHHHEYHCIGFILDGAGTAGFSGRQWDVHPGDINIIPAGVDHCEGFLTDQIAWCGIELPFVRDEFRVAAGRVFDTPRQIKGGPANPLAARIHQELRINDNISPMALQGLALELLAVLSRSAAPTMSRDRPAWLKGVEDRLRTEFLSPVTLTQLAADAGVHPVHLARSFRGQFGCSVGDFLRARRVEHARSMLKDTRWSLASIAQQAGFTDQAHFTRTFKQFVGMTPSAYRKNILTR